MNRLVSRPKPRILCAARRHIVYASADLIPTPVRYDVVVIGGGHAGVEASAAAARIGARTLLVTQNLSTIGEMSCNPSFGGIGKGTLIREIDAMDGIVGKVCDDTGIQFRMLNASRGPAVQGPRAQIDRDLFKEAVQKVIFNYKNLDVCAGTVDELLVEDQATSKPSIHALQLQCGVIISCHAVVITTGTFLNGEIHLGFKSWPAGRIGERPSTGLSSSLQRLGFKLGRLRTG